VSKNKIDKEYFAINQVFNTLYQDTDRTEKIDSYLEYKKSLLRDQKINQIINE